MAGYRCRFVHILHAAGDELFDLEVEIRLIGVTVKGERFVEVTIGVGESRAEKSYRVLTGKVETDVWFENRNVV